MTDNTYKCTPRQTKKHVLRAIQAGLVPYIKSSPGMGKSAIVKAIAKEYNLELLDHRLSTSAPEDLSGLPTFENGQATFAPFDIFPITTTPIPEGKTGWLLFLDEFSSASKAVQAAAYKLILDRMVGLKHLHTNVAIVAAGNLSTDRAIVNPLSTAMQSRVIHIHMVLSNEEYIKDILIGHNYDSRILAFLSYMNKHIHDFRPDHNDDTFCCPRTWEFMNKLIVNQPINDKDTPLFAGTITSGVAVEFVQFTKVYASLPNISMILANPENIPVPTDASTKWATVSHLLEHVDENNLNKISIYINRFTSEFRVLFFRALMVRKPMMRSHPGFTQAILDLGKYLND